MTRKAGLKRERTPLELVVLALSLLGILVIVGGLVWYGITAEADSPKLHTDIVSTGQSSGSDREYEVTVRNEGNVTAEELVVEVLSGDNTIEIELKAVAKGDEEKATVALPADGPAPTARVVTYKVP